MNFVLKLNFRNNIIEIELQIALNMTSSINFKRNMNY